MSPVGCCWAAIPHHLWFLPNVVPSPISRLPSHQLPIHALFAPGVNGLFLESKLLPSIPYVLPWLPYGFHISSMRVSLPHVQLGHPDCFRSHNKSPFPWSCVASHQLSPRLIFLLPLTGCIEGFFEAKKGIKNATENENSISKSFDSKSVIIWTSPGTMNGIVRKV